jgi:holdfast attachment protein HfaA
MQIRSIRVLSAFAALVAGFGAGALAHGQTMGSGSSSFNGGYGRYNGQENRPADFSIRDGSGNLAVVDGLIQTHAQSGGGGSASASASAGLTGGVGGSAASSSAIGNNLTVVTQGNYNTVIVNSTQINNGDVSAGSTAGGAN